MNAQDLFVFLSAMTEDQRKESAVYIRTAPKGLPFNVEPVAIAERSTYQFFGITLPCVVLEDSRFTPDETPEGTNDAPGT